MKCNPDINQRSKGQEEQRERTYVGVDEEDSTSRKGL